MKDRFCEDCGSMYPVEIAGDRTRVLCLATARFEGGPLRHDVDVSGVVVADRRNVDNHCQWFRRVNFRSRKYRRWIERYGDGERSRLENYPRRSEQGLLPKEDLESGEEQDEDSDSEAGESEGLD